MGVAGKFVLNIKRLGAKVIVMEERERERIGVAIRVEANLEWPVLFRLNRHGQTLVYIISTDVELV